MSSEVAWRGNTMHWNGILCAIALAAMCSPAAMAQTAHSVSTQRAAPAIRQHVYRQLRAARACLREDDMACAASLAEEVFASEDLNSYERAQAWNFQAALEFARGDSSAAIDAYTRMLAQDAAPAGLVRSAHYALAQLYLGDAQYDEALGAIDRWWEMAQPSAPEPFALRARIQYLRGAYDESLAAIEETFRVARAQDRLAEEDWYRIRYGSLLESGRKDEAAAVIESVLREWPRREYYLALDRLYSESGDEARRQALFEGLYKDGRISNGADLIRVAALRLDAGRLGAALDVLEQNRDLGYLRDGDSLRVLISRIRDWARGEPIEPVERETLLRNARLEQDQAEKPRNLRL